MGKPMSRKRRGKGRGGLGRVMAAVALAAVGLAMTRGMNLMHLGAFGPLVAILLWLFYTGVIERRRLGGFHYATAVVTVLASGFLARQIALENFRPLGRFAAGSHGAAMVEHLIGAALSLCWGSRPASRSGGWRRPGVGTSRRSSGGRSSGRSSRSRSCLPSSTKSRWRIRTPATASRPWASSRPGSRSEGSSKHFGRDRCGMILALASRLASEAVVLSAHLRSPPRIAPRNSPALPRPSSTSRDALVRSRASGRIRRGEEEHTEKL